MSNGIIHKGYAHSISEQGYKFSILEEFGPHLIDFRELTAESLQVPLIYQRS